jgi:hypothetical protein
MKAYQYILIRNFKVAKDAELKRPELLGDVRTVLAKDQDSALKMAARAIPDDIDIDDVEIAIRPF